MTRIRAAQMVYAGVEPEESPVGRRGFHTLYFTKDLIDRREVAEIEGRLGFSAGEGAPPKRVFFTVSSGKAVVARLLGLPTRDSSGRAGRYLAHALVLPGEGFLRAGADPWALLDTARFFDRVDEARAAGDFATGNLPAVELDVENRDPPEETASWPAGDLCGLAALGFQAGDLMAGKRGLAFTGSPGEIESALRVALGLVPAALRQACSFDTGFAGCNWVATPVWAAGFDRPPPESRFVQVDVRARRVADVPGPRPDHAGFRWLCRRLQSSAFVGLGAGLEEAWAIGEWLRSRDRAGTGLLGTSLQTVQEVRATSPGLLEARIRRTLDAVFPAPLASMAFAGVPAWETGRVWAAATDSLRPEDVARILEEVLLSRGFGRPDRAVIEAVSSMAGRLSLPPRVRIALAWWREDWRLLGYELAGAGPESRESIPLDAVDAVRALVAAGNAAALERRFPEWVRPSLDPGELKAIHRILAGVEGVPEGVRVHLDRCLPREETSRQGSRFGRFWRDLFGEEPER